MLIAARESFAAARKRLPYDAEVEYLESTGTQYIDIGVAVSDTMEVEAEIVFTSAKNTENDFGYIFRLNNTWQRFHVTTIRSGTSVISTSIWCGLFQGTKGSNVSGYDGFRVVSLSAALSLFKVNNSSYSMSRGTLSETGLTFFLFARNSNVEIGRKFAKMKCKWFKAWKGGVLLRDMIPVRFTNELGQSEGAMYDRLGTGGMNPDGSARTDGIYRKRGTGAFLYGPDK